MRKWIKRSVIVLTFTLLLFTTVHALEVDEPSPTNDFISNFDFIEDMKLDSNRYSQVDDYRVVDTELYIEITSEDQLITSNDKFELYFDEDYVSFKIKNKETNYVWSTSIPDVNAGTYTPLLESGIGLEYINVQKNMNITENIGLSNTKYSLETEQVDNGILLHITVDAYCARSQCDRFYPDYLAGTVTKEKMIEYGLTELGISFDLEVTLNEEGIRANIPVESILENNKEEALLSTFIIFPGLGATKMDEIPGYMILPDGSGALIRYEDNEGKFLTPFTERYYGLNYGLFENRESVLNYPLSMPIFGAVHGVNQNAMLGIIESGDFNSRLVAFPNGALNIDYNLIFTKIDFRQVYRQPFTSDGSQGTLRQLQTNHTDATIKYNFLDENDANYVGVGSSYREYLNDNGVLNQKVMESNIPINIEYFMSDSEKTFIGTALVEVTTIDQVKAMYDYLTSNGVSNQEVLLTGWNSGGASGHYPTDLSFERRLGSKSSFEELIAYIRQTNNVTLSNNFVISTESANVSYRRDVAAGTNRTKIMIPRDHEVSGDLYYLYPETTKSKALAYYEQFQDANVNVLFNSLGNNLVSYYKNDYYLREDAYQNYLEVMKAYQGIGSYAYPFSYAYQYTTSFYSAPLYNSQLKYYDDLVPLLQVVLHGSMDLFSTHLNFNSLGREQILALVDFGVSPSFLVTNEPSSSLKDTDSAYLFTTEFDLWKQTITQTYDYVNRALKHVDGEYITSRVVLDSGIVKVTYSNDVEIYINYTTDEYIGDVTIPALDYYVGGVDE